MMTKSKKTYSGEETKMNFIDKSIENYAVRKSETPSNLCDELESFTREQVEMPQMLTGRMEASFLGFLIHALGVKKVLEIGTFTGYSALAMAEQLPDDGKVVTLDINGETGKIAHDFWKQSPHGHKIQQVLAPALESMQQIKESFDLVFIDADKGNYLNYFKRSLEMITDNGVIVIDNVLWSGKVLQDNPETEDTRSIQELNDYVSSQPDLYATMLPVRDGMYLIRKR
jgi:caffeoyl-CoA O-methyltransferase